MMVSIGRGYAVGLGAGGAAELPVLVQNEMVCCVHLQVLLYFSVMYDIVFALVHLFAGWYKWHDVYGASVAVYGLFALNLVFVFVLEPFRLYLGYTGNLFERVPELFLFTFMCTLPCMGALIMEFLLVQHLPRLRNIRCSMVPSHPCMLNIEKASWMLRLALLGVELLLAVRALKRLISEQSARFFRSLEASAVQSRGERPAQDRCVCGNVFMIDSNFCRICGQPRRPQDVSGDPLLTRLPGAAARFQTGRNHGGATAPGMSAAAAGPAPRVYGRAAGDAGEVELAHAYYRPPRLHAD